MNSNLKEDFSDFINNHESAPDQLYKRIQKNIELSLHSRMIIFKFLSFQIFGAVITLSFCPQFSLGFIDGHGISHFFRMFGEWACAAFCGILFLSSGTLVAAYAMNRDEVYWIWNKYKFPLIIIPTLFWSFLMTLNLSFKLPLESALYHTIWISFAIIGQQLLLKIRNLNYSGILRAETTKS